MDPKENDIVLPSMRVTQKKHNEFLQSLEKNASAYGEEWELIADDLDWTVDEAKTYAYYYFHTLSQQSNNGSHEENVSQKSNKNNREIDKETESQEWEYDECILFDHLLLKFPHGSDERWINIASMMPHRSDKECKDRFMKTLQKSADA